MTGTASRVLVIEDDVPILRAIRRVVAEIPAKVFEARTGSDGIEMAASRRPDTIVLDLGLPDMPGLAVCEAIRRWSRVPIIVLSARQAEREKIALLNAGADDYITKPFSLSELGARIRTQLRRARGGLAGPAQQVVTVGGLEIDLGRRTVTRNGVNVHLTPTEWDLLRTFLSHRGRTLTHQQLFDAVWRRETGDANLYLRVYLTNLRRKLEQSSAAPELIVTEPGVGYRFVGE